MKIEEPVFLGWEDKKATGYQNFNIFLKSIEKDQISNIRMSVPIFPSMTGKRNPFVVKTPKPEIGPDNGGRSRT